MRRSVHPWTGMEAKDDAGVCINCAEKIAALILECGPGELAAKPCSGACREAIELYFSTPPERWRAPRAP